MVMQAIIAAWPSNVAVPVGPTHASTRPMTLVPSFALTRLIASQTLSIRKLVLVLVVALKPPSAAAGLLLLAAALL